VKNKFK